MNQRQFVKVSAPGRICLFGEHQDYLNLPVIAAAINLRISVSGYQTDDKNIALNLPDLQSNETFSIAERIPYQRKRDYFRSAVNVLRRNGIQLHAGVTATIRGEIPINAGTSSSSALVIAWVRFLAAQNAQNPNLSPEEIARLAHRAEVLEFSEPGGMMDHYASALGGVLYLEFAPKVTAERINTEPGTFVLGNSGEPKDTVSILARVKHGMLDILNRLTKQNPEFSLRHLSSGQLGEIKASLTKDEYKLLEGTWRNYQITMQAKNLLQQTEPARNQLGELLNEHQAILRDTLKISTPKIDGMIDAALAAGALGAKINGSGGGGCMFAYAPDNPEEVAAAIERSGGKSYIVKVDDGVRVDKVDSETDS